MLGYTEEGRTYERSYEVILRETIASTTTILK